jgi:hypothetical protein
MARRRAKNFDAFTQRNSWITAAIHEQLLRIRYHVVAQDISPMPESWSRRARYVEAAANWSSRLRWVPVRRGQWRVAVVASQVEYVSITVV